MKKFLRFLAIIISVLFIPHQSIAQICFDPAVSYPAGSINSISLCPGDFNNDSITDVAVANINTGGSNVSILAGNGTGIFSPDSNFAVGPLPGSICSADFNRDGNPDLATTNSGPGNVSILLGAGGGSFNSVPGFSTGVYFPSSICTADINGDTIPDLVLTTNFNFVEVALGDGLGGFGIPAHVTAGNSTRFVLSNDFNNDGKADLAVTTYNGNSRVTVLLNNGAGGFPSATSYVTGDSPVSLASADFNNDGKMDLVTANMLNNVTGNISVFLNNGTGGFSAATNFGIGDSTVPKSICSADFDGDGINDLAVACVAHNSIPNVSVLKGDGMGGFAVPVIFAVDSFPNSIISSDFNGDGKMDLALAGAKSNIDQGTVTVLLNCSITGIARVADESLQILAYPNPSNREIRIISPDDIDAIRITNLQGQIIYQARTNEKNLSLDLDEPGIYFLHVTSGKNESTQKLVVVK